MASRPGGTLGTELTGPASTAPGRAQDLNDRSPLQVTLIGADHVGSYVFLASDKGPRRHHRPL